ncbi:MAG: winged helix-turn-helix transcriptional regulator [Clostridia bacterium]|nr:winged helix-turn-helix transcriptional regulator [Clostridia bacterium]
MKRIGVISGNPRVYNKIRLLLRGIAEVERVGADCDPEAYSLIFADTESAERPDFPSVTLGDGCDIPLPFRHEEILDAVMGRGEDSESALTLSKDGRHVHLFGEAIKLTEVEYKLLACLSDAEGFVSREELLAAVWGEGFDAGVVNVYVYYLRRKLEKDGRKIIISSRNEGYRIDEKYRRKS